MRPMMLDQETARLLRRGVKTQRRWPLPWPEQYALPGVVELRVPAHQALNGKGEAEGRWGWTDPEGNWYPAPIAGPGSVLYVREAWQSVSPAVAGVAKKLGIPVVKGETDWAVQRSALEEGAIGNTVVEKWRAAIHMPRWAPTQWVRVEELYMHRLQDITVQEVRGEGLDLGDEGATLASFVPFWDSRNPDAKWEQNPMVAAVRFRILSREEAEVGDAAQATPATPAPVRGARRSRSRRDRDGAEAGQAREAGGGEGAGGPGGAAAGRPAGDV